VEAGLLVARLCVSLLRDIDLLVFGRERWFLPARLENIEGIRANGSRGIGTPSL